jgi:hypothetical protein
MANVVEIILRGVDQYSRGFKQAHDEMALLKAGAAAMGTALLAASTTAAAGLVALTIEAVRAADEMGKTAQKAGVSTEFLSALGHAAKLSDVSIESLTVGLRQLAKHMAETDRGGESLESELLTLADRFADMPDGAEKTALAVAKFGKAGSDLIPLLNAGATGIREMMAEAERLGLVISTGTAAQAEAFNDALTRVNSGLHGLGNRIATGVMPLLKELADGLQVGTDHFGSMATGAEAWGRRLGQTFIAMKIAWDQADLLHAWERAGLVMELGEAEARAAAARRAAAAADASAISQSSKDSVADLKEQIGWQRLAMETAKLEMAQTGTRTNLSATERAGLDAVQIAAYRDNLSQVVVLTQKLFTLEPTPVLTQMKEFASIAQEQIASQTMLNAMEKAFSDERAQDYTRKAEMARVANDQILKYEQDLGRKLQAEYDKQLRDRKAGLQGILGATGSLFGSLAALSASHGKKMWGLTQAFRLAEAIVNTAAGVTQALGSFPPPYCFVVAALVAAAGAVQIATIAAAKPSGVAHGGLDYVPSTGTYVLERGEAVLQARQNQALGEFLESHQSSRPIVVNVDGEPLFRLLSDGLRSGRIEVPTRALV